MLSAYCEFEGLVVQIWPPASVGRMSLAGDEAVAQLDVHGRAPSKKSA